MGFKPSSSPFFRAVNPLQMAEFSEEIDRSKFQDSLRFRTREMALGVARAVVSQDGEILLSEAEAIRDDLKTKLYCLGPNMEDDFFALDHLLSCLNFLLEEPEIRRKLGAFSPPLSSKLAERVILDTLWPEPIRVLQPGHLVKAILASWFYRLRQVTGSCFATAPAILIQSGNPLLLIQDLLDLMIHGGLRRIVSGKEYTVPLCPSTTHSDLLRPIPPSNSKKYLSKNPVFLAAVLEGGVPLAVWESSLEKQGGATTPMGLIDRVLKTALGVDDEEIEEEKRVEKDSSILAVKAGLFYQKSDRSKKVEEWKKKRELSLRVYQSFCDCALIRCWESTIASFCDVKADFGRWNLSVSLGLDPANPNGIGAFLRSEIERKLEQIKSSLDAIRIDFENSAGAARALETMYAQSVDSFRRAQLRSEWQTASLRADEAKREWDEKQKIAQGLVDLFPFLIESFDRMIPEFFQEIFDPALFSATGNNLDDSPAGFRLAYKHGRTHSAAWTFIRDQESFTTVLAEFCQSVEREVLWQRPEVGKATEELMGALGRFIRSDKFIEESIKRSEQNRWIEGNHKKPWEYISGGTIQTLLMAYSSRAVPMSQKSKRVESIEQLSLFLDECKQQDSAPTPLLMHSPSHAFVFRPEWMPDSQENQFQKMKNFWKNRELNQDKEEFLLLSFLETLPEQVQPLLHHRLRLRGWSGSLAGLRSHLIAECRELEEEIDRFFYSSIPLLSPEECQKVEEDLGIETHDAYSNKRYWSPADLFQFLRSKMIKTEGGYASRDVACEIARLMREHGLAPPEPILFGDTNWSSGMFGLVISPAGQKELWRFHRLGIRGYPMRKWFQSQAGGEWVCFDRPAEFFLPANKNRR